MLIGHAEQQRAWRAALGSGRQHHAWLLAGPPGVGKASFADWAARLALDAVHPSTSAARLIAARSHPDYHLVQREVWDKSSPPRIVPYDQRKEDEPAARSIRIAQIRALEPVLALAPSLSSRRIVVLDAADDLERPAANALLKMLEEPPRGTIFLLISHASGRLLPTIRSRCRLLRFDRLPDDQLTKILSESLPEMAELERSSLVRAAAGSPGAALALAGADLPALEAAIERIGRGGDMTNAARSALAKSMAAKSASARYNAFLQRAPTYIGDRARTLEGSRLEKALDAWRQARHLAAIAVPQSLPPETVAFELAGHIAALADPPSRAKA